MKSSGGIEVRDNSHSALRPDHADFCLHKNGVDELMKGGERAFTGRASILSERSIDR